MSTRIHFKPLPKYELMMKVKKPTIIDQIDSTGYYHYFYYNPDSIKLLLDQTSSSSVQTQLRFCYLTLDQTEVKDCSPENLSIDLNGRNIYSYSEELCNQIREPIDITSYCLPYSTNLLKFSMNRPDYVWSIPCAFEISLVKCHGSKSLFERIKNDFNKYLPHEYTKAMIKNILAANQQILDNDIEVLNETAKYSLLCPISGSRIETACRTTACVHIQCFDLWSFLTISDIKYDWLCPICTKPAMPNLLRIDKLFNEILSLTHQSFDEVMFDSDYSWIAYKKLDSSFHQILDQTITLEDSFVESQNQTSFTDILNSSDMKNRDQLNNFKLTDFSVHEQIEKIRK